MDLPIVDEDRSAYPGDRRGRRTFGAEIDDQAIGHTVAPEAPLALVCKFERHIAQHYDMRMSRYPAQPFRLRGRRLEIEDAVAEKFPPQGSDLGPFEGFSGLLFPDI